MDYTRLIDRGGYYSEWQDANNALLPVGIVLAKFEKVVILADNASAAAGLSLAPTEPSSTLNLPPDERKPKNGEVLAMKYGDGVTRFDKLPYFFPFTKVNYPNKSGRVLGTQSVGATHQYNHPHDVNRAIFGAPYQDPSGTIAFFNAVGNPKGVAQGGLYEYGDERGNVSVRLTPAMNTFQIQQGRIYQNNVMLGLAENAATGQTIPVFDRQISADYVIASVTDRPYTREVFGGDVTDRRPGDQGGANTKNVTNHNALYADFSHPMYFGRVSEAVHAQLIGNADPFNRAALGAWILNESVRVGGQVAASLYHPNNLQYAPGDISYGGEYIVYMIPEIWGPLKSVIDPMNANQLNGGAFAQTAQSGVFSATVTKAGFYAGVPYRLYVSQQQAGKQNYKYQR